MHVRLSETTYKRIEAAGIVLPILHSDEHGHHYVDIPDAVIKNVRKNFGDDIDWGINQTINHNQREGWWPKGLGPHNWD